MPIVFSAITPHPPILIPAIGKENLGRLKSTLEAFKKLKEDLYVCQPDTIFIISPHGSIQRDSFTMNLSPEFEGNFEDFGDFATKINFAGNIGLAYKIRESMETKAPVQLMSETLLDHGSLVPLYLLAQNLPKIKIIPLYYSGLDLRAHFKFGQLLKREFLVSHERVAIIASGDLSHRLTKDAPAGYSPRGKKFDKKLIEYLKKKDVKNIIGMKHDLIYEAGECGLKSIVILLGILDGINCKPKLLSYEGPFGVGYLVMQFEM